MKERLRKVGKVAMIFVLGMLVMYGIERWSKHTGNSYIIRFMNIWKEFPVQELAPEPADDFAWSEDIPEFILKNMPIATILGYDGIQYSYGENKIKIEKNIFTGEKMEVWVNNKIGCTLDGFSIYSAGEDIAIYGYWNDEFRRIRLGKNKDDVEIETLTPNVEIPLSAHSIYAIETQNEYWLSFSEDGYVSAYKDRQRIGDRVQIADSFLGMHVGSMFCDESGNLYMPYVVNSNGTKKFICHKVDVLDKSEFEMFLDMEIWIRDCLIISNSVFPTFRENGKVTALVPNELEKFIQYENGETELSIDDDFGWHYVEIK